MRLLIYITLFFLPSIAEAQDYYTNDPMTYSIAIIALVTILTFFWVRRFKPKK